MNIPRGNHSEPNHNPNTEDGCQSLIEKGHWTVELVQLSGCQDLSIFFYFTSLSKKMPYLCQRHAEFGMKHCILNCKW